jgi:hypothetical protein
MAIKGFKEVVEKKGYRLDDKDRQIFEKEIKRGYFGFDVGDIIEFVIYDASDNQLPQAIVNDKKVRYISYTDENIKAYFDKVPENKFNKKTNNAKEYYIDTEKLIKEAGYSNGVFKTQITLLNRRLGSEPRLFDKVWIHEISPSRTEVRVLPVVEDGTAIANSDLQARYDTFVNCGTFTADILIFFDDFVNQLDVTEIVKKMLMKKGTISEGEDYIKLIETEFKLLNFEIYITQVKKLLQEIIDNYRMNKYYNPFESNFGQPTGDSFGVEFDIENVYDEICNMASDAAEFTLPRQSIRLNTLKSKTQQTTLDEIKKILRTVRSNDEYASTKPPVLSAQIRGCMDSSAKNYNPNATIPSSCVYDIQTKKYRDVKVCDDRNATNYGSDGTCVYPPKCTDPNASNYGSYGACVYPAPPPPPPPPPNPPPPPPPGPSTYSISANLHEANPSPANGRLIQQIKIQASPSNIKKFGANAHQAKITGLPSWCKLTFGSRNLGYSTGACILRVQVERNDGAARSGTISFSSTLPGNPTTSVKITQAGTTKVSPPPPPPPPNPPAPPKPAFNTNGPQTIKFTYTGAVSGQNLIRVTSTDSWTVSTTGIAGINYHPYSGTGNGIIEVQDCFRKVGTSDKGGQITVRSSSGITRKHYLLQEGVPSGNLGFGNMGGDTVYTGGTGGKFEV